MGDHGEEGEEVDRRIGTTIAGKYRIDAPLGKGGMGSVYRAMHLGLGEPVAVKVLQSMFAQMPAIRTRFKREAIALARLRHPSVVSVIDVGEENGEPYIVLELVQGTSLEKVAYDKEPVSLERIGLLFDQILQVLELVHAEGIVHRDLKLENVMLVSPPNTSEYVKVLDFGLAHIDVSGGLRLTHTGSVQGTPHYMSPEQCRGEIVGPPTDIYALGMMLYEMVAGAHPFDGRDAAQLMAQHLFVEPPPIATRGRMQVVPAGLEALVLRSLAKNAADRPTAAQMRAELGDALAGLDARSRAAFEALDRARVGGLSRDERAIGGSGKRPSDSRALANEGVRALLVGLSAERASALKTALGIAGVRASTGTGSERELQDANVRVLVLTDSEFALEEMQRARASAASKPLHVVVVDVTSAERTARLVRDGVSDVAHVSLGPPEIARKIARLMKRR